VALPALHKVKKKLAVEIDAEIVDRIESIAKAQGRTLDDTVEVLLRAGLGAHDALEWARAEMERLVAHVRSEIEALRARLEAQQLPVA
jgi:hypothetical protein